MTETGDEQQWIAQSQAGDGEAFEKLVRRYQHMIHSLTYRMTGSSSDAEDLAQEAFIRAYQRLSSFRGESSFSSWLYRVAMNACLNWRKSVERRNQLHEQWATRDEPGGDSAAQDDLMAGLQQALLRLKPKHRAAIVLTVCEGMNHAEAARALGCSETTVSWRVHVARKQLKQWLSRKAVDA